MEAEVATYVAIALALMKAFELIARLTPTKADDNIVQKIRKLSAIIGVAVPDRKG